MKILIMPLFQMPSGHHQVSDALIHVLKQKFPQAEIKKVDILSYCNKHMEKLVGDLYIKWIRQYPQSYHMLYGIYAGKRKKVQRSQRVRPLSFYFDKKMQRLLKEEKPDFIICTHSFPSRILEKLKKTGKINVPVANVYTDFFTSAIWGKSAIDYHCVPNEEAKMELIVRHGVFAEQIIVTGIPVHEQITPNTIIKRGNITSLNVLFAGGNLGLGDMLPLMQNTATTKMTYTVLCGKNEELYTTLKELNNPYIRPLSYVTSREEMNELYDTVDAIVTKPGGVTISEVLQKRLPAFTLSCLPGQEEVNLHYLEDKGLIYPIENLQDMAYIIERTLSDDMERNRFNRRVNNYLQKIERTAYEALYEFISQHQVKDPQFNSLFLK